jgi:hypothetical protein
VVFAVKAFLYGVAMENKKLPVRKVVTKASQAGIDQGLGKYLS